MQRIVTGLGLAVMAWLLIWTVAGIVRGQEVALSRAPVAAGGVVLVHLLAFATMHGKSRRVARRARAGDVPGWLAGQVEKVARRTDLLVFASLALVAAAVLLGLAVEGSAGGRRLAFPGVAAAALAFNLGTLGAEVLAIGVQSRVIRDFDRSRTGVETR